MTKLGWVVMLALSSSLTVAAAQIPPAGAGGGAAATTGKATEQGAGDVYLAKDFWAKHAKGGSMTKDDAMKFKGADGKNVDLQKLDFDNDGKISEREWNTYHETAGAAGIGAAGKGK